MLSLLVTSMQQSTCISWVSWCNCSRLPPSPQPLSPSTECQGNGHHLQLWGAPPAAKELEDPFWPEEADPVSSVPMATFTPTILIVMQILHRHHSSWHPQLCPHHSSNTSAKPAKDTANDGIPFITWPQAPTKGGPKGFSNKLLQLQEKMNMALEQLLTNRVTMNFHHKELEINTELMACLNDVQAAEAIKEAEVHCQSVACTLQLAHWNNVLVLECEAKVAEGQDCQAFVEAFGAAVQACLPKSCGALLYPLQILTTYVPQPPSWRCWPQPSYGLWQTEGHYQYLPLQCCRWVKMPAPFLDQHVPTPRQDEEEAANIDDMPNEHPCRKQKEARLVGKALKEPWREAFSKESDIVKVTRWAYQKAHWTNFEQEESYDLSCIFCQMATSTYLWALRSMWCRRARVARRTSWLLTGWKGLLQKTSAFSRLPHPHNHQRSWASRASIPSRSCNDEVA